MCFRPGTASNNSGTQMDVCPFCGQPVAFQEGTTEGQCPYCGEYITSNPPSEYSTDPSHDYLKQFGV